MTTKTTTIPLTSDSQSAPSTGRTSVPATNAAHSAPPYTLRLCHVTEGCLGRARGLHVDRALALFRRMSEILQERYPEARVWLELVPDTEGPPTLPAACPPASLDGLELFLSEQEER